MQAQGTITFKLIPAGVNAHLRESKVRVRAFFDFEPKQDKHIPCKEAGLPFSKGDILHIVSQEDLYWLVLSVHNFVNLYSHILFAMLTKYSMARYCTKSCC